MSDKILSFPLGYLDSFDFLTEKEAYYQLRLDAVELLNQVHAGVRSLTARNVEGLRFVNSVGEKLGFELLEFVNPFEQEP